MAAAGRPKLRVKIVAGNTKGSESPNYIVWFLLSADKTAVERPFAGVAFAIHTSPHPHGCVWSGQRFGHVWVPFFSYRRLSC